MSTFQALTPWVTREAVRQLEESLLSSRRLLPHLARWYGPAPTRTVQPGDGIVPFDEHGVIESDDDDYEDEDEACR